jgi:hypothetical protein
MCDERIHELQKPCHSSATGANAAQNDCQCTVLGERFSFYCRGGQEPPYMAALIHRKVSVCLNRYKCSPSKETIGANSVIRGWCEYPCQPGAYVCEIPHAARADRSVFLRVRDSYPTKRAAGLRLCMNARSM